METTIKEGLQRNKAWYIMKDNIVQVGGRIYVPPEPHLREEILEQHHTAPIVGHPGVFRTLELIE